MGRLRSVEKQCSSVNSVLSEPAKGQRLDWHRVGTERGPRRGVRVGVTRAFVRPCGVDADRPARPPAGRDASSRVRRARRLRRAPSPGLGPRGRARGHGHGHAHGDRHPETECRPLAVPDDGLDELMRRSARLAASVGAVAAARLSDG
jgi:hypothetical protein